MATVIDGKKSLAELKSSISSGNIIVLYYMDGCSFCDSLMPEWEIFKSSAADNDSGIYGLKISEIERSYLDQFPESNVTGFPTIKFHKSPDMSSSSSSTQSSLKLNNKPKLVDLLRNIVTNNGRNNMNNSTTEIIFNGKRTHMNLLKFAKANISQNNTNNTHHVTSSSNTKAKKRKTTIKTKKAKLNKRKFSNNSNNMSKAEYMGAKASEDKAIKAIESQVLSPKKKSKSK